jgi:hypothetical protein
MEKDALLQGEMIGIRCAIARQNPSRCMAVLSCAVDYRSCAMSMHVMVRFGRWQEIIDAPLPDGLLFRQ